MPQMLYDYGPVTPQTVADEAVAAIARAVALVDEAVARLLGRNCQVIPVGYGPLPPKRICFLCVENRSAEEIGDFRDQLYQTIDIKILESGAFQPISKRFLDAGLAQMRLRPDELLLPQNMRMFAAVMEQQGQPFDYLLYALAAGVLVTVSFSFLLWLRF